MDIHNAIKERSASLTPSAYMQMVGIVQSLALYFLLTEASFSKYVAGKEAISDDGLWISAMQVAIGFFLIVLTWHVNVQNAIIFKRVFGICDSLIPFAFVITEYFIAINSKSTNMIHWKWSILMFMVVAIVAYVHLFTVARKDFPVENGPVFLKIRQYPILIISYVLIVGIVAGAGQAQIIPDLILIIIIGVLVLGGAVLHRQGFWMRVLRA